MLEAETMDYGEPWTGLVDAGEACAAFLCDRDHYDVADFWSRDESTVRATREHAIARAKRAAAAVNACQGLVLPDDVPVGAVRELVEAAREMREQAIGCWVNHYGDNPEGSPTPHHIARVDAALRALGIGEDGSHG